MSPTDEQTREAAIQMLRDKVDQEFERLFFGEDGKPKREKKSVVRNRQNLNWYKIKKAKKLMKELK